MKQFILENPVVSILLIILSCMVIGVIIFYLYKHFYDHQLNMALQKKKKIHWLSPQSTIWVWIGCSILFIVIVVSMIFFVPKDDDNLETCVPSDTVMYAYDKSDIEEQIKSIRNDSKSISIQEEHPNQHVTTTYAINDQGEYVYAVVYDLLREPKENEHFAVSIMESDGWYGFESELSSQSIIYISKGNVDTFCNGQKRKIHIYNYVKGENTDPIDYFDEYTIEKGGIKR